MDNNHLEKVKSIFDNTLAYTSGNSTILARTIMVQDFLYEFAYNSIMDLGCGDGSIGLGLSNVDTLIHFVDLSNNMLEIARKNAEAKGFIYVETSQGDATKFRSGKKYDVVLCLGVLAHVPSVKATLETVTAHLNSGGRAIIQFTEKNSVEGFLTYKFYGATVNGYKINVTSRKDIEVLLHSLSLKVVKEKRYSESSLGIAKLGLNLAVNFKIATSKLGVIGNLFSGTLLLLEKKK